MRIEESVAVLSLLSMLILKWNCRWKYPSFTSFSFVFYKKKSANFILFDFFNCVHIVKIHILFHNLLLSGWWIKRKEQKKTKRNSIESKLNFALLLFIHLCMCTWFSLTQAVPFHMGDRNIECGKCLFLLHVRS